MKKTKQRYCPFCGDTELELIGGVGGAVAVYCTRCGSATTYHDTPSEALAELDEAIGLTDGVKNENATQADFEAIGGNDIDRSGSNNGSN